MFVSLALLLQVRRNPTMSRPGKSKQHSKGNARINTHFKQQQQLFKESIKY